MNDMSQGGDRARRWKARAGLALCAAGVVMGAAGVTAALQDLWVDETTAGVITGLGFGLFAVGALIAWMQRRTGSDGRPEGRGERLQAQRAMMLWIFPMVTLVFLVQATRALSDIMAGDGGFSDYLSVSLPVLYAWLAASITMGWDANSRKHRRYLEDELTQVLRARAIVWAFLVLMAGGTIALGLGVWRAEVGIAAIPFALAAAGATAGLRFAWLDREAGKDG